MGVILPHGYSFGFQQKEQELPEEWSSHKDDESTRGWLLCFLTLGPEVAWHAATFSDYFKQVQDQVRGQGQHLMSFWGRSLSYKAKNMDTERVRTGTILTL